MDTKKMNFFIPRLLLICLFIGININRINAEDYGEGFYYESASQWYVITCMEGSYYDPVFDECRTPGNTDYRFEVVIKELDQYGNFLGYHDGCSEEEGKQCSIIIRLAPNIVQQIAGNNVVRKVVE